MTGDELFAQLYRAVRAAYDAGLCVIPPLNDGTKHPIVDWLRYQNERTTLDQLRGWYKSRGCTGIGVVCGPVSGDLELFEAEDVDTLDRFRLAMADADEHELLHRLDTGYLEQAPRGGVHWLYRCTPSERNKRLASRPKRPDEMRHPKDRRQVLLETRGGGGYAVLAPSFGTVHPTGRPYVLLAGGFDTIPTLTVDERARLWTVARTLDEMPPVELVTKKTGSRTNCGSDSVMEEFNAGATWSEILEPHGWTLHRAHGDRQEWCRPGKRHATSATAICDGPLYVFSSSTDFEPDQAYSKFAAYAVLNHGGDMAAAARTIRAWRREPA